MFIDFEPIEIVFAMFCTFLVVLKDSVKRLDTKTLEQEKAHSMASGNLDEKCTETIWHCL